MEGIQLTCTRDGRLFANGVATGFDVESGSIPKAGKVWYLQRRGYCFDAFAWHGRKADVLTAARVFIEGATQGQGESVLQAVQRALRLCLETGSANVVPLSRADVGKVSL